MRAGVGINVPGGGSWSTPRRSKPKSGADDQLRCVGESRITSHNIAAFRHPTDSMKDSKHGELKEEERRWVESQILPRNIAKLILKIIRHDSRGRRVKKETPQEINSESVIGRAGGIELDGSIHSPRPILSTIFGLLGLIS